MKYKILTAIVLLAIIVASTKNIDITNSQVVAKDSKSTCVIKHIIDGDTLWCDDVKYRLAGVDSEECKKHKKDGKSTCIKSKSRDYLLQYTNKPAKIEKVSKSFDRIVAYVYVDGVDIGFKSICDGINKKHTKYNYYANKDC